jgi:hypothetical protein
VVKLRWARRSLTSSPLPRLGTSSGAPSEQGRPEPRQLSGANLGNVALGSTGLFLADLSEADLVGAKVTDLQLTGASHSKARKCPTAQSTTDPELTIQDCALAGESSRLSRTTVRDTITMTIAGLDQLV